MPAQLPKSETRPLLSVTDMMRGGILRAPVTAALIGINLAVFVAMLANGAGFWHSTNTIQLAWGANFGPATKDGEWWRLATAMFLHFGILHLALNMWALWDGGRLVERLYGMRRFVAIYLISGVVGNLLSLIVRGDYAVSGGASGAIFGVYGALLVSLWRERQQIEPYEFRWMFGAAAIFSIATVCLGFMITGIDNAAHIGGLITGALTGVVLTRRVTSNSPRPGRSRWVAAASLLVAVATMIARVPAPAYRWHDELEARAMVQEFLADDRRYSDRLQSILTTGRRRGESFEQLAGRIESDVALEYRDSFEELAGVDLDSMAPSVKTLEILKNYALLRGEAVQSLAEGVRLKDEKRILEALEQVKKAPLAASGASTAPATP